MNEGVLVLAKKYQSLLKEKGYKAKELKNLDSKIDAAVFMQEHEGIFNHVLWMCKELEKTVEKDMEKSQRWLGFVQACLWVGGFYSINELRAQIKSINLL
jgi:hypothetical protein